MSLFRKSERPFVAALSKIVTCNPFLPERVEWERQALGNEFVEVPRGYHLLYGKGHVYPNIVALCRRAESLAKKARQRLAENERATHDDLLLYEDLILWHLYDAGKDAFLQVITASTPKESQRCLANLWPEFQDKFDHYFTSTKRQFPSRHEAAHIFACAFHVDRAYYYIYHNIVGASEPIARLRAAVWESIFSGDLRRWARALWHRMDDNPTLITGPSGTGKELVARAVGLSRHARFDPKKKTFTLGHPLSFHAVNLAALSPTLVESELFGHVGGSFTDARDRVGWLETCSNDDGTLFLDEIGEVSPAIQVMLLRVIQQREFHRVGESKFQTFKGKFIVATNRDLSEEIAEKRFREDLYYRLCADAIATPSLSEQLQDCPEDLFALIEFVAEQVTDATEAKLLSEEVHEWVRKHLPDYTWPGNFRELEQCVRSILLHREYYPPRRTMRDEHRGFAQQVTEGSLSHAELMRRYFELVLEQQGGNLQQAARVLDVNWRTVKKWVEL